MRRLPAALGLTALLLALAVAAPATRADGPAKPATAKQPAGDDTPGEEPAAAETPEDVFNSGIAAINSGQYASARRLGKKLAETPATVAKGLWLQARADRESADPNRTLKLLDESRATVDSDPRLRLEYGWLLLAAGRYPDAEKVGHAVAPKTKEGDFAIEAQCLLGEALWLQGKYDEAKPILDLASTAGISVKIEDKAPDDFMLAERAWASGWAAYRLNDLHTAQARWDVGRRAHRHHAPSWVALGRIFLESNKDDSARKNYCEEVYGSLRGSGFNPNHAEAHFIAAQSYLVRWNQGAATAEMAKALKLNPFFVEALAAQSAFLIQHDQYEEGLKLADRALAVNPNSALGLGARALWAATLAKKDEYAALETRVLASNKGPGDFYQVVGDGLASRHRFDESIAIYRKGIEKQPTLWTLQRELGRSLLNNGDSKGGEDALKTAHKNDTLRNSVFTENLLSLLDTYKYFKRFDMVDGKFSVLVFEDETDIVAPYYERELTATARELTAKYDGFSPAWPVTIEAFHRHKDFEVRTVGIEGLPALGACFGKLVTLDSPSARDPGTYNWASTLRHEMDHVYQLQMSNGQIPRWLAEGCSVYEERRCRPEWERHMEDQRAAQGEGVQHLVRRRLARAVRLLPRLHHGRVHRQRVRQLLACHHHDPRVRGQENAG
jgi:tetratricopeptide (TPR) repeat protein